MRERFIWRSRWAAIGAAVAVSIGAGGVFFTQAASPESSVVAIDPVRVLDTRDPTNLGLNGPFASTTPQDLQITGSIPTSGGNQIVVPAGATGVFLNATNVNSTADGFVSVRPATATGSPSSSNLNFEMQKINPNAVLVELPVGGADDGKIEITFDAFGASGPTSDMLIDVVGYITDARFTSLETRVTALEAKVAPLVNSVSASAGGNQTVTLQGGTDLVVRSVSLMPPADGTVIVNSSNDADQSGVAVLVARCSITTGTTTDSSFLQVTHVADAQQQTMSGTRGFPVTAGALFTVNLVCDAFAGAGSIRDSNLTAIFAPS